MTKTKQPKPIKAWGIVTKDGELGPDLYLRRKEVRLFQDKQAGDRIVRVEIKVLK